MINVLIPIGLLIISHVNKRYTRPIFEICFMLTIRTAKYCQLRLLIVVVIILSKTKVFSNNDLEHIFFLWEVINSN